MFSGERHPTAERWARQGLYIPSSIDSTVEEIEFVAGAVTEAISRTTWL
jgi:hypothetical protein